MTHESLENRINTVLINIKIERETQGWSQAYMADKLSISQNGYSKIELGRSKISLRKLFMVADIFDVHISKLLA